MVTGAVALAEYAHEVAAKYPVNVALHTDHCPKDKLDGFVRPLIAISAERVAAGREPLFQSHMWDGSAVPLDENLEIAAELLASAPRRKIILEVEIGVVGGEEDGVVGEINEKLYTTPEDALATVEALGPRREGPLHAGRDLRQRARRLQAGQRQAAARASSRRSRTRSAPSTARTSRSTSSSTAAPARCSEEIREAVDYGVVKMNIDTDTQYAFTRPVADHMFSNYDGVLKVDGEVGNKKAYDPRAWGKVGRGRHGRPRRRGLPGPALRGTSCPKLPTSSKPRKTQPSESSSVSHKPRARARSCLL